MAITGSSPTPALRFLLPTRPWPLPGTGLSPARKCSRAQPQCTALTSVQLGPAPTCRPGRGPRCPGQAPTTQAPATLARPPLPTMLPSLQTATLNKTDAVTDSEDCVSQEFLEPRFIQISSACTVLSMLSQQGGKVGGLR